MATVFSSNLMNEVRHECGYGKEKYHRPITLHEEIKQPIKIKGNMVAARHAHGNELAYFFYSLLKPALIYQLLHDYGKTKVVS